jgi:hypothetical protein
MARRTRSLRGRPQCRRTSAGHDKAIPVNTQNDNAEDGQAAVAASMLAGLQEDFPQYRIWQEIVCGRARYVARSRHAAARPHTLVTADPEELRAGLSARPGHPHHAAAGRSADAPAGSTPVTAMALPQDRTARSRASTEAPGGPA